MGNVGVGDSALANTRAQWNEQKDSANINHSTPTALFICKSGAGNSKPAAHVIKQHVEGIRPPLSAGKPAVEGTNGSRMNREKTSANDQEAPARLAEIEGSKISANEIPKTTLPQARCFHCQSGY